jgi:hypothetical protein
MFNLQDDNLSYVIINSDKQDQTILENNKNSERLCSVLYSKDYTVYPIYEHNQESTTKSYLSLIPLKDNDSIRQEILHILEFLDINSSVLKYHGEKNPILLKKNGLESPLKTKFYPSEETEKIYILEGTSFSFDNDIRYFYPKNKSHLKNGTIVEFLNNNNIWKSKEIQNIDEEYEKMFSLLIKYNKLRIPSY